MGEPLQLASKTFVSTDENESVYGLFIDGEFQYFCHDNSMAIEFLIDIVNEYDKKFKQGHPEYRTFIEKKNEWKYLIQRVKDGVIFNGKPKQTHILELKRAMKLLKPVE